MNKVIRFVQNYLIIALPFVIACMVWSTLLPEERSWPHTAIKILWDVLGINLMSWFAVLMVFLTSTVLFPSVREKTLQRLGQLKERDEREQAITGKASRFTYISTLSLTLFFLFFSVISLKVTSLPKEPGMNKDPSRPSRRVSISAHFNLLKQEQAYHEGIGAMETSAAEKVLIDSNRIALSTPAILLVLLCWQLSAFNMTTRRTFSAS